MDANFKLSKCENDVYHLVQELSTITRRVSDPIDVDLLARPSAYESPHRKIATIAEILKHHESAIQAFLTQQSGAFAAANHASDRLLSTPSARVSEGAMALNQEMERCRTLLDIIAGELANAGRCRQMLARSSSRIGDGLKSPVDVYQKPHDQLRNEYGVPILMNETLYRLYPPANHSPTATSPPVPKLKKQPTDRITLTDKVLRGQGVIEIPRGVSYWVKPPTEEFQHFEEFPLGVIPGAPRARIDYGNAYQKPLYAKRNPYDWY